MMRTDFLSRYLLIFGMIVLAACGGDAEPAEPQTLVVYSGRSESLVDPIIARFEQETGIDVEVRYGDTAQLAAALGEEGAQSAADVFWAQDAGALGAVHAAGLLASLPDSILQAVPARFRSNAGTWVAVSGRARTLAYSSARVDTTALPQSVFDLTDPQYEGRVGWAPTNGSFQAFVTAMRKMEGDERTREWLEGMKANGAKSYPKNSAIVQAIADGEVDFGLPNHYYLYRFKSEDAQFPVEQTFFAPGDPGDLVNVAGVGVLQNGDAQAPALRFISFLLSPSAQEYFTSETFEYPVVEGVEPSFRLVSSERLSELQPAVDLDELRDLEGTLNLLREAELL